MIRGGWRTGLLGAAAATLAAGCGRLLDLPAPPLDQPAAVARLEPARAFAEQLVTLHGERLGPDAAAVQVRFGASAARAAERVADDGTWAVVRVPDDATSGAVAVQTPRGAAAGAPAFEFLGAGRLREGRVVTSRGLRPAVGVVEAAGGRRSVVVTLENQTGGLTRAGAYVRLSDEVPLAAAAAGDVLAIVRGSPCATALCRPGALSLLVFEADWDPFEVELDLPEGATDVGGPFRIALTGDGGLALVTAAGAVWIADLFSAVSVRMTLAPPKAPHVAWLRDARFVLALAEGDFVLVDAEPGGARQAWNPLPHLRTAERILAAAPPSRLAVGAIEGGPVHVYDTSGEGLPVLVQTLDIQLLPWVLRAVLLPQSSRLALLGERALAVFDLGTGLALGAVPLQQPTSLLAGADGMLYAGRLGGVSVVSPQTGSLAGETELRGQWHSPALRTLACGPEGAPTEVVEAASRGRGEVAAFDARTLARRTDCSDRSALLPGQVVGLAPAPDAGRVVLLRGEGGPATLVRHDAAGRGATLALPGVNVVDSALGYLALSPDGRTLGVLHGHGTAPALELVDLGRPFEPGTTAARLAGVRKWAADDAGRLVVWTGTALRGLELAAAVRGEEKPLWGDVPLVASQGNVQLVWTGRQMVTAIRADVSSGGGTVTGGVLRGLSMETGATLWETTLPEAPGAIVAAPGGRRLSWLRMDTVQQSVELAGLRLGDDGRPEGTEPSVMLPLQLGSDPAGYDYPPGLVYSADGARLYVAGGDTDQLLLLR